MGMVSPDIKGDNFAGAITPGWQRAPPPCGSQGSPIGCKLDRRYLDRKPAAE